MKFFLDTANVKEIQDDKQPENENNSIHSGGLFLVPQSYGHTTTTVKDSLICAG